ncbi:S1C family serine protease [Paenibacillus gansuensis]|uniref:S1C family serine protease n=1 Tax=Paenibacillus gansuensis TaxID=306542 RepID=A0ABW5PKW1_9BACL
MSFFGDEFYTTKVPVRERLVRSIKGRATSSPRMWTVVAVTCVLSVLVTAFAITAMDGKSEGAGGKAALSDRMGIAGNDKIIHAAAKVNASVVSVINQQNGDLDESGNQVQGESALGSGVIFAKEGKIARIITNSHVVDNSADLQVILSDGTQKNAKLIGQDPITDLAVLEIDSAGVKNVAELGNSEQLQIGEWVIAIGNPLGLGYSQSITFGIVSSTHRVLPISLSNDGTYDWEQEVIQTDAAINQGNSGGALVNLDGKVVGINSMKVADMGVEGLGFAIPINDAMPIVNELIKHGKVDRPYLGVSTIDLQNYLGEEGSEDSPTDVLKLPKDVDTGIIVLEAQGPALKAGLRFNDVIVKMDDVDIASELDLRKYLYEKKSIGDTVKISYYREGKLETVDVVLEQRADEE